MKRALVWLRIVLSAVALLVPSGSALADPGGSTEAAVAAQLFQDAKALYGEGRYAEACAKFEQSLAQKPGLGTEFNLADCWDRLGRTASAYGRFVHVEAETRKLGQSERAALAHERARQLEPRLTRILFKVKHPVAGLSLERNGTVVERERWSTPILVDPGMHELRATAPHKVPWSAKLTANEPGTLLVELPELADERTIPPAAPAKVVPRQPAPARATEPEPRADGTQRTLTLVLAGTGAAALLGGIAMAEQYVGSQQDAEAVCPASHGCTAGEVAMHDGLVEDARTARTWAFVGTGVGAAALLGAAYLYFTSPTHDEGPKRAARVRAMPLLSPHEGAFGATLQGVF